MAQNDYPLVQFRPITKSLKWLVSDCLQSLREVNSTGILGAITSSNLLELSEATYDIKHIATANTVFDLPDGASLVLTTDVSLDRKKRLYERSILPDVPCTDALTEAETWLQSFG